MSEYEWKNNSENENDGSAYENGQEKNEQENGYRSDAYGYQNGYRNEQGNQYGQNGYRNAPGGNYGNPNGPQGGRDPYSYGYTVGHEGKKGGNVGALVATLLLVAALFVGGFFVIRSIAGKTTSDVNPSAAESPAQNNAPTVSSEQADRNNHTVGLATVSKEDKEKGDGSVIITDVSGVVDSVMPCVVAITDNLEVTSQNSFNPYYFFFYGNGGNQQPSTEEKVASGSGVIIGESDSELLIVTNNHVVNNEGNYTTYTVASTGLTVAFNDGTTADAIIKGTDDQLDLAVVAVKLNDISAETLESIRVAVVGDSDEIKVGQGVIAIGNALGYGQSVTTGIVSAKEREVNFDDNMRTLLQTDAAINPGNSGGGLFNADGELIGINSAKYSSESVEGMCFAIPISSVTDVIEDLMNRTPLAEEEQGYLGLNGETVPASYIENYGYPEGVLITRIGEGSPAEKAGLQIYDIITAIDGKEVKEMAAMKKLVNSYPAGTAIEITFQRPDGRNFREMTTQAILVSYNELNQIQ